VITGRLGELGPDRIDFRLLELPRVGDAPWRLLRARNASVRRARVEPLHHKPLLSLDRGSRAGRRSGSDG